MTLHKIPRDEWVRRFHARLAERLGSHEMAAGAVAAELESWPPIDDHPVTGMPNDWEMTEPEDAADENLSNWTD